MVIVLMGASGTGKTAVTNELKNRINFKTYSGSDYQRLARNDEEAWAVFVDLLKSNTADIIYMTHEAEKYYKLKDVEGILFIKLQIDLETMKNRYRDRLFMDDLPIYIEEKLEDSFNEWDAVKVEHTFDVHDTDMAAEIAADIIRIMGENSAE